MSNRYLALLDEIKWLSSNDTVDLEFCKLYIMGKHHRQGVGIQSFKYFLEYFYSDTWRSFPKDLL